MISVQEQILNLIKESLYQSTISNWKFENCPPVYISLFEMHKTFFLPLQYSILHRCFSNNGNFFCKYFIVPNWFRIYQRNETTEYINSDRRQCSRRTRFYIQSKFYFICRVRFSVGNMMMNNQLHSEHVLGFIY